MYASSAFGVLSPKNKHDCISSFYINFKSDFSFFVTKALLSPVLQHISTLYIPSTVKTRPVSETAQILLGIRFTVSSGNPNMKK